MLKSQLIRRAILICTIAVALFIQASAQEVTPRYYIVQPQEGLYRVAVKNNVTMAEIRSWNNLTSDVLSVGQKLIVGYYDTQSKSTEEKKTTPQNTEVVNGNKQPKYYIVQPKEGLYGVATKNNVTMAQIRSWNNLTSDVLSPGQKLIVGYESTSTVAKQDNTNLYDEYIINGDEAFDEERYQDAKKYYEQALSVKPDSFYPKKKLETIKSLTAQTSNAETYQQAIVQGAEYSRQGKYSEAKKAYQEALSYKPGDTYATKKLEEIEAKLKEVSVEEDDLEETEKEEVVEDLETEEQEVVETEDSETPSSEEEEIEGLYYEDHDLLPVNLYPESQSYYPSRYSLNYYYPGYPDAPVDFNYPADIRDYPGGYYNTNSPYYP